MIRRNAPFTGILLSVLVAAAIPACNTVTKKSDPKVTNGRLIGSEEFPAVVALDVGGLCTGTFVSDSTLITAAHCVSDDGERTGSVRVGSLGVTTDKVFFNKSWDGRVGPYDLAIAIFSRGTSGVKRDLRLSRPAAGSPITIVGFGKSDHFNDNSAGRKRTGNNTLDYNTGGVLRFSGETNSDRGGNGQDSASSNGDSGGPMFVDGKLVGVTSGGYAENGTKYSIYVDVHSDSNLAFLRDAIANKGARIPSLVDDGDDGDGTDDADQDLFVALPKPENTSDDIFRLHFGVKGEVASVRFCEADGPSLCPDGADELTGTNRLFDIAGRQVFKAASSTTLSEGKTLSVVAVDGDGKILSLRAIKFERI